ncbi:MAG TPA: peptide ABC transporter substrate-binding protein [Actinoplanes sp.]|nr:peptide ABC transporter substrate-binding protein [Actinoplanes sp.]
MALYRDPADKRVIVPKKGGGVALNFAHPVAWWIFVSMTVIPLVVVAGIMIAVLA